MIAIRWSECGSLRRPLLIRWLERQTRCVSSRLWLKRAFSLNSDISGRGVVMVRSLVALALGAAGAGAAPVHVPVTKRPRTASALRTLSRQYGSPIGFSNLTDFQDSESF